MLSAGCGFVGTNCRNILIYGHLSCLGKDHKLAWSGIGLEVFEELCSMETLNGLRDMFWSDGWVGMFRTVQLTPVRYGKLQAYRCMSIADITPQS